MISIYCVCVCVCDMFISHKSTYIHTHTYEDIYRIINASISGRKDGKILDIASLSHWKGRVGGACIYIAPPANQYSSKILCSCVQSHIYIHTTRRPRLQGQKKGFIYVLVARVSYSIISRRTLRQMPPSIFIESTCLYYIYIHTKVTLPRHFFLLRHCIEEHPLRSRNLK